MVIESASDPKVGEFDDETFAKEDIGRFDIAVDHAVFVGKTESFERVFEDEKGFVEGQLKLGETADVFVEIDTLNKFHDDEGVFAFFVHGADADDMLVVESCLCAGFAEEALGGRVSRTQRKARFEAFDGDRYIQKDIGSFVDDGGAAFAEVVVDAVGVFEQASEGGGGWVVQGGLPRVQRGVNQLRR